MATIPTASRRIITSATRRASHTSGPIWDLQTAYVRKVIDTLHKCDNVLYEIQNEGDATSITWQKAMIDYIHHYEQTTYGYKHPVGMTVGWGNDAWGHAPTWSPEHAYHQQCRLDRAQRF